MSTSVPLYGFGVGGGAGATLTVTAKSGATVTISKDGKTKTKVSDSTGTAVFKGLSAGTWTVTITSGAQTSTRTVDVTLDYYTAISLDLIKGSDECTPTTGGWTYGAKSASSNSGIVSPTKTVLSDGIKYYAKGQGTAGSYYGWYVTTNNKIDLSTYDTLTLDGIYSGYNSHMVIWSDHGKYTSDNIVAVVDVAETTPVTLDVSSLTGSYYIGFYGEVVGSDFMELTINNMYLE